MAPAVFSNSLKSGEFRAMTTLRIFLCFNNPRLPSLQLGVGSSERKYLNATAIWKSSL